MYFQVIRFPNQFLLASFFQLYLQTFSIRCQGRILLTVANLQIANNIFGDGDPEACQSFPLFFTHITHSHAVLVLE